VTGRRNTRGAVAAVVFLACSALAGSAAAAPESPRIVGGSEADPGAWAFAAALTARGGGQFCGASVVSPRVVVTAAHCAVEESGRPASPHAIRVVTGRPDLRDETQGQRLRVSEVHVHRQYLRRRNRDVAVLVLEQPTDAAPVLLPTPSEDTSETAPDAQLRVAGWGGTTRTGGSPSSVLLAVDVFAQDDSVCESHFPFFRAGEELCAFGEKQADGTYDDSCFGDSGGPLVADSSRGPLLVGIVSYGGPLCGVTKPGVYARVHRNIGFIGRKGGL
jgi:secreted trypsin-like serine protease